MVRSLFLSFLALCSFVGADAANIASISNGQYDDPSTWNCTCVPTDTDVVIVRHKVIVSVASEAMRVVIRSNARLTSFAPLEILGALKIVNGGEMKNFDLLTIKGFYVLNGVHSGTGTTDLRGERISGTGEMSNTGSFEISGGKVVIRPNSNLDFSSVTTILEDRTRVINNATFKFGRVSGTARNTIVNRRNAVLEFGYNVPLVRLTTFQDNNTVIYSAPGPITQFVLSANPGYQNLILKGTTGEEKRGLADEIRVDRKLTIQNVRFKAGDNTTDYDIKMNGDWVNEGGQFFPGTSLVNFSGRGNSIAHSSGQETFGRIEFSGNTHLQSEIKVMNSLTLTDSLDQAGKAVQIVGDWIGNGGVLADETGLVEFVEDGNSTISGITNFYNLSIVKDAGFEVELGTGMAIVWETLLLTNGELVTNDRVQIASSPRGTGRVGQVTNGTVVGEMYVYRYTSFPTNAWHNICAPIKDMSLTEWKSDFVTTGFPGSDFPDYYFTNIMTYDETVDGHRDTGFVNVENITDALRDGQGVRAFLPGQYSLFEVKGEINVGDFNFPISYTDTPTGDASADGWNLMANPYASSIDWDIPDGWEKTDMNNAVYVWDPVTEQYASYVDGIGTNGGSPIIPSSQAFWVQATSSSSALQIKEAAKTKVTEVYRSPDFAREHLSLLVSSANGRSDEAAFRLKTDATRDFNQGLDAVELRSTDTEVPSIAFVSEDGLDCSIYSISEMREEVSIPITLTNGIDGPVLISCEGYSNFAHLGLHILDAETGEEHPLSESGTIQIELEAGEYIGRFFLMRTVSEIESMVALAPEDDGIESDEEIVKTITTTENELNVWVVNDVLTISSIDGQKTVDVRLYDLNGKLIDQMDRQVVDPQLDLSLQNTVGLLIVEITDRTSGQTLTKKLRR